MEPVIIWVLLTWNRPNPQAPTAPQMTVSSMGNAFFETEGACLWTIKAVIRADDLTHYSCAKTVVSHAEMTRLQTEAAIGKK